MQGQYRTPTQESGLDKFADSTYSESGSGQSRNVGDTPSAYSTDARATAEHLKPKGRNLQEVSDFGEAENAPNASMQYGNEIGGENDPGRQAEQAFANRTAVSAGDAAYPGAGKQGPDVNQGGFERLNADEQA